MKLQVLLSIINSKNPKEFVKTTNITGDYIIINQIFKENIKLTNYTEKNKKIISIRDKGLSKSRNLAIKNSTSDICLLSDDDMFYEEDYEKTILEAYKKYPDADLIAFVVEHENKKDEKKILKEGRLNLLTSLKISSVQLTFKKSSIENKNIKFDENFGSGSKYFMGEENIFMYDCLKNKLKIYYVPIKIGTLKVINESNWFKGYNKDYFKVKGIVYYRMSKLLSLFLILQFSLRKCKLYKNEINLFDSIKYMCKGIKEYKKGE